jgi:hypothetical protein
MPKNKKDNKKENKKKTNKKKKEQKLNILQKLSKAREVVRESDLDKKGTNTYSKYDYFTPEQVEQLVAKACRETNTIVLCNLKVDEYGYYQTLDFVDLEEPHSSIHFELRTEKGKIKATSATQQMGGTDTYSERYIKMKVFQIKDNNLDPDSQDNREEKKSEKKEVKTAKEVEDLL